MNVYDLIQQSIDVKERILSDKKIIESIKNMINIIVKCFNEGNKLILFGNGGSAADAQHIAAEFVGRFIIERRGLPAIAITTDTSIITSISNDYNYEYIFERQVEALAKSGDITIGISTSGNSNNINKAFIKGKEIGTFNFALLGNQGGVCKKYSDECIIVPSKDTPRIQEAHIMIGHIICELVEKNIVSSNRIE